jgi:hypothetical protein
MKIVLTPDWFLGKDILIDSFSFIVLIIFSVLAIRSYKLNKKNRNLLYLGTGFGLIALAQLACIFTKLILYYDIGPAQAIGQAIVTGQYLKSVDIFYYMGFFFHKFLILIGLYIIYRLPQKKIYMGDYALVLFFILLSAILSEYGGFFYLFHLTAFILLILIVGNYYRIYKKNKFTNTKILITAFSILALAHIIYLFSKIDVVFAVANIIELISYVILLFLIIRILKHGEKKKPHGYNIRYADNRPGKGLGH